MSKLRKWVRLGVNISGLFIIMALGYRATFLDHGRQSVVDLALLYIMPVWKDKD
jgi:hypothetical protein